MRLHIIAITLLSAVIGTSVVSQAAVYNDRVYRLGDDPLEGTITPGVTTVGQGAGGISGVTVDSGVPGDPSGSFLDVEQSGGPVYVNVATLGSGRTGIGVRFDGVDDLLFGQSLNRPDEMAGPTAINMIPPKVANYPLNYDTITARGAQMWVYPNSAKVGVARQAILMDTIAAGGVAITADGKWTQINDGHTDVGEGVAVVGNQWHHVMQHIYRSADPGAPKVVPGTGSGNLGFTGVVYVNGIAASANNDSPAPGDFAAGPRAGRLSIGAEEVPGDGETPIFANHFHGAVDDVEMYVFGNNSSLTGPPAGRNYGTFNLFVDNDWIASQIAALPGGMLKNGDVDRDGNVDPDDVTDFLAGWRQTKVLSGAHNDVTVGDWETWGWGDLDVNGVVDIFDLALMQNALASNGLAAITGAQLNGASVPEPATMVGLLVGIVVAGFGYRRCH